MLSGDSFKVIFGGSSVTAGSHPRLSVSSVSLVTPSLTNTFPSVPLYLSYVFSGHDNFLWQAYPQVYERRLRPAFDALGVNFEARNIGMGAMGCFPEDPCYEAQAGDDADLYSW